jgi:hypothetical protein
VEGSLSGVKYFDKQTGQGERLEAMVKLTCSGSGKMKKKRKEEESGFTRPDLVITSW